MKNNNNNTNKLNLHRGDFVHIKFNKNINKMCTFYEYDKKQKHYLFKDNNGFFELSENYINNSNIILEIMPGL